LPGRAALSAVLVAIASVMLTAAPGPSGAASPVLYVDRASVGGACSDGRSVGEAGFVGSPWCSLERAVAAAPAGSVVVVRGGSYPELSVDGDGGRSSVVTFKAGAGESVSVAGLDLEAGWLRFEGFRLRGQVALQGSHHLQVVGNDISPEGVMVRGSRDVLVEGNHIHDLRRDAGCPSAPSVGNGYAVWLNSSSGVRSARVTIRGNRIANVPHDAFQVGSTDDLLIEGNDVSGVEADGCGDHSDVLQIVEGERIVVRSNRFHDSVHGFMVNGHGDTFRGGLRFENNLIHGISGSFGMNLYNVEGLALVNNTVWDTALGVRLRDTTENPTVMRVSVRNNIFDQYSSECDSVGCVTYQDHNLIGRGDRRGAHDLAGSPSFVDAAVGNYELAPGSRGIDAASSDDAPATDRLGRGRSDDPATANSGTGTQTHYDIGAHERLGGPPPEPAPDPLPGPGPTTDLDPPAGFDLEVSRRPDRSSPTGLAGETHGGAIHVFATSTVTGVSRVRFWLNDPQRTGTAYRSEAAAPWDFAGGTTTTANPYDTARLADGPHSITAVFSTATGTHVTTETFTVDNTPDPEPEPTPEPTPEPVPTPGPEPAPAPPPTKGKGPKKRQVTLLADLDGGAVALRVSAERGQRRSRALDGATLSGRTYVFAPTLAPVVRVRFFLDERPDATPFRTGRAPLDTRRLRNGRHTITAVLQSLTGSTTVTARFRVANRRRGGCRRARVC
jgi:hypothetical protein